MSSATLVRDFVARLRALFGKRMRSAFDEIIGASASVGAGSRQTTRAVAAATKPAAAATGPTKKTAPARMGGRRTDAEIEKTVSRVREFVVANPGSRMEHIGAGLGQSTKDLARPVAKLLTSGDIRREGRKRATRYFPGGGGDTAATKAPSKGKAKAKGAQKAKKTSRNASATTTTAG